MLNDVFYAFGTLCNGIYIPDMSNPIVTVNDNKRLKQDNVKPSYLWNCRLDHINERRMTMLHKSGNICKSCLLGKMTKLTFKGNGKRASGHLDLMHTDVCALMSTHPRGGFIYFITFTSDFSRYGYLYVMKYKSEAFEKFKEFRIEVEKQFGRSIKTLISDRGGEYLSQEFLDYLADHGVQSQRTTLHAITQWCG